MSIEHAAKESNPVQEVWNLLCYQYTSDIWLDWDSNPGLQVMSLTWNLSTIEQSLMPGSNRRT